MNNRHFKVGGIYYELHRAKHEARNTKRQKPGENIMNTQNQPTDENVKDLVCPDCRAELTRRRTRKPDACEMLCGGCGQIFDVCDLETVEKLKQT